ncbi:MAG: hypothetical protein GY722_21365 [bacterium]|nr:hypothetical protein [bacterium]
MLKWRILIMVAMAVAILGAGCSDDTNTTTTAGSVAADDVVFGQGALPDTIPSYFPLPAGTAIGSTMVIRDGLTEVVIRVSAVQGVTAQFFNQSLPEEGFTVDRSEADGNGWVIDFSDGDAKGTLDITEPQEGISQAVLRFDVP